MTKIAGSGSNPDPLVGGMDTVLLSVTTECVPSRVFASIPPLLVIIKFGQDFYPKLPAVPVPIK
jgi:hypothetical protein